MIKHESQALEGQQISSNNVQIPSNDTSSQPLREKLLNQTQLDPQPATQTEAVDQTEKKAPKQRLMSLDVHRGFTILGMIMADQTPQIQGACWWLLHPDWNGLSVADLVFPSFLFIMGTAIPLAVNKNKTLKFRNVVRVLLLFLIGFALNLIDQVFDFSSVRIMGILQRMSLCYGIVLFVHWFSQYGAHPIKRKVSAIFMMGFVVLYTALMLTWSDQAPGCSRENNLEQGCTFAGYVDLKVFGLTRLYQYKAPDPEGIVSTLTATFTTYVGYVFGLMVQQMKNQPHRLVKYWLIFSVIALVMVYPLTLLMQFNKHLYSISYLFVTMSICSTALSFFMVVADILPKRFPQIRSKITTLATPIIWMGVNPLTIFIVLQLIGSLINGWIQYDDGMTPYISFYDACFAWAGTYAGTLLYSVFYGILFIFIAGLLFRFKIFIKL